MKTITIIPTSEEVVPLLEQLLYNNEWVMDWKINDSEIEYKHRIPNEETLLAIKEVEEGDLIEIGTFEDYLKWEESV